MANAWENAPFVEEAPQNVGNSWEAAPFAQEVAQPVKQPTIAVQPQQPVSVLNKYLNNPLAGIGETAMSIGSGLAASAYGGLKGAGMLAYGSGSQEAAKAVEAAQQAYTYQPRTQEGKALVHIAGIPIEYASKAMGVGGGAVGETLGGQTGRDIGEAVGGALPATLGTLLGGAGALRSAKGVPTPNIPVISDVKKVMSPAGKQAIAQEHVRGFVPKVELPETISALERRAGEVVPGSPVTSADAIARANRELALKGDARRFGGGIVTAQEQMARTPETSSMLNTLKLQQEQARANVLSEGAGNVPRYNAALAEREAVTKPLYEQVEASNAIVDVTPTNMLLDTLIAKRAGDKTLVTALNDVKTSLVDEAGNARTSPSVLQSSVDNINTLLTKQENASIRKPLLEAKESLVAQINKVEAAQGLATTKFAELSKPINQMDLWRALQQKFISPTGKESPGVYIKALQDEAALIRRATGFKRGTGLEDIFNTKQSALAAKLAAEMEMELTKKRMSGEVAVQGVGRAAEGFEPKLPNFLWRPSMVANFILKHVAKSANKEVNVMAAEILADPKKLASVLKEINQPARKGVLKAIRDIAISKEAVALGASNKPMEIEIVGGNDETPTSP